MVIASAGRRPFFRDQDAAPMDHAPKKVTLSQIGQIALTVRDMDRAITFYRACLGLKFLFQAPNVAFFDCGGIRLMLGQSENPQQKPNGTIMYYRVDDLDTVFAALKEDGV